VFCQLEYLRHCLRPRIRRALEELPATLDETYDRTLEELGNQNWEYAHRLFQCVAVASRPLRVGELADFLALDFDTDPPTIQEDWREENPARAVQSTCSSLLSIVDSNGFAVIQFAHFSVKEYLTSKRLAEAKDTISRFHISITQAHTIVSQSCVGVLLHIDEEATKDDLEELPLARYAAEHLLNHARFEGVSPIIQNAMRSLFDPDNHHLEVWVWILDPESRERRRNSSQPGESPLHYAAGCGLDDVVNFLIVERSQDVSARNAEDETPLILASREGHSAVARVLLKHGANTETRDNEGWSALERASQNGHVGVVRVLLEYRADANALDAYNRTALHRASDYGQAAVARVLLQHGADVNAKIKDDRTPLHLAWEEGVARVLLEYGASLDARDGENRTPLHHALQWQHADVARVLVERGADANVRDLKNKSPLHLASRRGYLDIVRLMLKQRYSDSDINVRDEDGQTPFDMASLYRHHDVMRFLLEHGAEGHRA
jgi:ankyrin repeat protein